MNKTICRKNIPPVATRRLPIRNHSSRWKVLVYTQPSSRYTVRARCHPVCESAAVLKTARREAYLRVEIVCTRKMKDNKELEPLRVGTCINKAVS